MKDLIKKQEEVVNDIVGRIRYWDTERKEKLREGLLELISKVRKETAEAVADKMIGEERDSDDSMLSKKCKSRLTAFKAIMDYQGDLGYNERIKEEKEIKKQIIKSL